MTVIFSCTFPGGAAIAADTLMTDHETGQTVMNSQKILAVGHRVSIAQAGSFNGTQEVWKKLEGIPPESVTPNSVVETIRRYGGPIYQRKAANGPTKMCYLVAGLENDGTPVIRWLDFDRSNFDGVFGPCQIAALGTLPNVLKIANEALLASVKSNSKIVRLDEWCRQVVATESAASPRYVGFPATLVVMKEDGGFGKLIGPNDEPETGYEVFWP